MGFGTWYEDKVLPHVIRCGCANAHIAALRAKIVPLAQGRVFEIGVGGGLNQPFYDTAKVTGFSGIDPSGKLLDFARGAARRGNGVGMAISARGWGKRSRLMMVSSTAWYAPSPCVRCRIMRRSCGKCTAS